MKFIILTKFGRKLEINKLLWQPFKSFYFIAFNIRKHIDEEINFLLEILEIKKEVFSNMYA